MWHPPGGRPAAAEDAQIQPVPEVWPSAAAAWPAASQRVAIRAIGHAPMADHSSGCCSAMRPPARSAATPYLRAPLLLCRNANLIVLRLISEERVSVAVVMLVRRDARQRGALVGGWSEPVRPRARGCAAPSPAAGRHLSRTPARARLLAVPRHAIDSRAVASCGRAAGPTLPPWASRTSALRPSSCLGCPSRRLRLEVRRVLAEESVRIGVPRDSAVTQSCLRLDGLLRDRHVGFGQSRNTLGQSVQCAFSLQPGIPRAVSRRRSSQAVPSIIRPRPALQKSGRARAAGSGVAPVADSACSSRRISCLSLRH